MKNMLSIIIMLFVFIGCNADVMSSNEDNVINNTASSMHSIKDLTLELEPINQMSGLCQCECNTGNEEDLQPEIEWLGSCMSELHCLMQCGNYCYFEWPEITGTMGEILWQVSNHECIDIGE